MYTYVFQYTASRVIPLVNELSLHIYHHPGYVKRRQQEPMKEFSEADQICIVSRTFAKMEDW
jgi:hypothetical protein